MRLSQVGDLAMCNTLWSVRRRCTLHCVIARQDSAARRRCAVVPLLQRHISDMPFIEAAFAHSAPQFSELERTMCFAHLQVFRLVPMRREPQSALGDGAAYRSSVRSGKQIGRGAASLRAKPLCKRNPLATKRSGRWCSISQLR